jgi:hypothetical protein
VQEQLKVLRDDNDVAMLEFRANRKLGVTLRDLVAEGKVEEAQAMAEEQVGRWAYNEGLFAAHVIGCSCRCSSHIIQW